MEDESSGPNQLAKCNANFNQLLASMIASEVFLLCAGSTSQAPKKGKAGGETSRLQQGGFKNVDVLSFPETSQDF